MNKLIFSSILLLSCNITSYAQDKKSMQEQIERLEKRVERLQSLVSELKERPKFDPTDSDADGIIDILDKEKRTPDGAAVDVKGVALDSDSDRIPNYKDKEPFSPIGFKIDEDGVAQIPKNLYLTEAQIEIITKNKIDRELIFPKPNPKSGFSSDFFEIITFNSKETKIISNEGIESLLKTVSLLKQNPIINLVIVGFATDGINELENQMISYNRANNAIDILVEKFGMDRYRLILNYGGSYNRLSTELKFNKINQRIEIKISQGETDMMAPKK
jgi:OmpA-OmpF porin, OOP family